MADWVALDGMAQATRPSAASPKGRVLLYETALRPRRRDIQPNTSCHWLAEGQLRPGGVHLSAGHAIVSP